MPNDPRLIKALVKKKKAERAAEKKCEICNKKNDTVRTRRTKNEEYQGGCGDSFCWASCDMDTCKTREFSVRMCDTCATTLEAK